MDYFEYEDEDYLYDCKVDDELEEKLYGKKKETSEETDEN